MAEIAASPFRRLIRGIGIRQVRLATGLVLFAYIVSHFANHALGNISVGAMDGALYYHAMLWQSWPVLVLLYGSVLIHLSLGIWALYARRQFRWTGIELTQSSLPLPRPQAAGMGITGVMAGATAMASVSASAPSSSAAVMPMTAAMCSAVCARLTASAGGP